MPNTIHKAYGWRGPSLPGSYHFLYAPAKLPSSLPDAIDLTPAMPAILDQGELGSCVFNATATAAQFAEMQKFDKADADFQPSRLFMYYNARKLMGASLVGQDTGADYGMAMKACERFGVADERDWPYYADRFTVEPSVSIYTKAKREVVHIQFAVPQSQAHFEACLADGFPLMIGVTLYDSFESDDVTATGIVPMPGSCENSVGGHAMLAVGYDRIKRLFKVRNSWGVGWGDQGHCYMPYNYLLDHSLADDFRTIRAMM